MQYKVESKVNFEDKDYTERNQNLLRVDKFTFILKAS